MEMCPFAQHLAQVMRLVGGAKKGNEEDILSLHITLVTGIGFNNGGLWTQNGPVSISVTSGTGKPQQTS